ncbi:hypothetical protein LUW74_46445 [Actinomadura madurae]|uniref:hypothetical protein n=1 Tax=Actinomadura madurae TaxID=1993 RepID=UPI002026E0EE|nr:hypothetical protein [Actinomadura madurae]URN10059.1 hypothetical protein LUW74_46445 [Actinomadura madurae]
MNPATGLKCWIPGLQVWYGLYTRSWWAYVPGRPDRLIEAPSPELLAQRLTSLATTAGVRDRTPSRGQRTRA